MRAAIGGDFVGSRFERSIWSEGYFPAVRCLDYDRPPRADGRGEVADTFDLLAPSCHITDDSILTVALMDWLLHGGELRTVLRTYFRRSGQPALFGKVFRQWAARD